MINNVEKNNKIVIYLNLKGAIQKINKQIKTLN